jgi:hypothetical protein
MIGSWILTRLRARPDARFFNADSPAAPFALGVFPDEHNASRFERGDKLDQRINRASDNPFARLHSLDRRHGQVRELGQLTLVESNQRPCRAKLGRRYHGSAMDMDGFEVLFLARNRYKDV